MFKIGDIIDYSYYEAVEVIKKDGIHYVLKDKKGNEKSVYIKLVDKYGKLSEKENFE